MSQERESIGLVDSCWTSGWHALYTRHQHEKVVAQALSGKGFEVFLPLYTAARRWKDRRKELSLPLFPSYVFIHGGLDRMLNIVTTPGVHALVAWGGRPAVIPQEEIEAVQRLIQSSMSVEPHPYLKSGDWVRIKSGPLEGIRGILLRKKSTYRLVLSVEMLEKSVAVEVDVSAVDRIDRADEKSTYACRCEGVTQKHLITSPFVFGSSNGRT